MTWLTALRFLAPILAVAGLYFYAHDAGWSERDSTVAQEKHDAAQAAVTIALTDERAACAKDLKLVGGITNDLRKRAAADADRYAAAVDSLYDATHGGASESPSPGPAPSGDNGTPGGGRLYYADPGGARPAIDRARIASKQAGQLIGCQAYVNGLPD